MSILFCLFSQGQASGGHYHSLDQLSNEIGRTIDVGIVTFGPSDSPVLKQNPFFIRHVLFEGILGLRGLNRAIKNELDKSSVSVLHCFDTESMNWLLLTPATWRIPIVLTKCGGPNPARRKWQVADEIVLFSKENYNWFQENMSYENNRLHLIPNRVNQLKLINEKHRIEKRKAKTINFLRISRLGGAYEKTLWDTLRMIAVLKEEYPVHLYIIGRIQDPVRFDAFQEVIENEQLPVTIITDERASRGADFLYLADFVIGTGRSFMEALSLGIPSLTPASNLDWPVLVQTENFGTLFKTNFSERNVADINSKKENKERLIRLLSDSKAYQAAREEALSLFDEYFSIKDVGRMYAVVYHKAVSTKILRIKLIMANWAYLAKSIAGK